MFYKDSCSEADSLIRCDSTICKYIKCQLIIICNLTNTSILNCKINSLNRCIYRINSDDINRCICFFILIRTNVASAVADGEFHLKSCIRATKICNYKIRIDDLDIAVYMNIGCSDNTVTSYIDISLLRLIC